jgi:Flp pilus assembly pilin Flp
MKEVITRFVRDESGQDLIEYGLLVGIITVACILAIGVIGTKVKNYYTTLSADLP